MRVSLRPDLEAFLKEKVQVGRYRNANDAINDGLQLLRERDTAEFESLKALLAQRIKESRRGDSVPFDAKVRDGIRRRGMKRLATLKRARG
jgi:putative addiction module CopG family antidote